MSSHGGRFDDPMGDKKTSHGGQKVLTCPPIMCYTLLKQMEVKKMLLGKENQKWDFSKEEMFVIKWFEANGFDVELKEQFVSKTKFIVRKDDVVDNFDLTQGLKKMNVKQYMQQYERQFELLKKMKEKVST